MVMTLPASLITVTKYSKFLALVMFVLLPFTGFFFGMEYQQKLDGVPQVSNPVQYSNPSPTPTPTPTTTATASVIARLDASNWHTYDNKDYTVKYPPESKLFDVDHFFIVTSDYQFHSRAMLPVNCPQILLGRHKQLSRS